MMDSRPEKLERRLLIGLTIAFLFAACLTIGAGIAETFFCLH